MTDTTTTELIEFTESTDSTVRLYTDSESDVEEFFQLFGEFLNFSIDRAYYSKSNQEYIDGIFYSYDMSRKASTGEEINAPDSVTSLVQWTMPDIILTRDGDPIISVEITHQQIRGINVAQRIPRQIKAAREGVPNFLFQKIGDDTEPHQVTWMCKTFTKATKIYNTPSLPVFFKDPDDTTSVSVPHRNERRKVIAQMLNRAASKRNESPFTVLPDIWSEVLSYADQFDRDTITHTLHQSPRKRKWIRIYDDELLYINNSSKDAKSFENKGSGNWDPYPGLVKMIDILFCMNERGEKKRKLITYLRNIPKDFWWFEERSSIYYDLIELFSDEIYFANDNISID